MEAQIRQCEKCGKRTDFWTELAGISTEGNDSKQWRLVLCSECENTTTLHAAKQHASHHITQRSRSQ